MQWIDPRPHGPLDDAGRSSMTQLPDDGPGEKLMDVRKADQCKRKSIATCVEEAVAFSAVAVLAVTEAFVLVDSVVVFKHSNN